MPGDPSAAREWRAAHERVCALVERAAGDGTDLTATRVPATPDWSVRDLLAHMTGLGADVLAGDEPDDHNPSWTQAQVDARAGHDAVTVAAEWRSLADRVEQHVREVDARPLADAVIHEQDLRGALGVPGARDTVGLALVRERMAGRFAAAVEDRPPVRLDGGTWTWASGDGEPGLVLAAPAHDLFRALTARRTVAQLRSWTTAGDVGPYLDAFAGLGALPVEPLDE